jgi:VanZ family protein
MHFLSEQKRLFVRRLAGLAGLAVAVAIAVLSVLPGDELPDVNLSDKAEHAIAYAVLAMTISLWLGRRRLLVAVFLAVGYGALLELVQAVAGTGRTPSLLDEGANLAGACVGAGVAWLIMYAVRQR